MPPYLKILVAIDLEDPVNAERELARVAWFAADERVHVRLVNVRPTPPVGYALYLPDSFETEELAIRDEALFGWAQTLRLPTSRVSTTIRTGAIAGEVLAEVVDSGCDLVVVGAHHPTTLSRLLGSNADRIVREARVSVLVARD